MAGKCVLLVLDGLGDRAQISLGGLTPLQAARTPVLDGLAGRGANGLYHPGILGQPHPSETAHFSLFGYPEEDFPGRGPLEALGGGVPLEPEEVAILAHFVSLEVADGCLYLAKDTPAVRAEETRALAQAVDTFEAEGVKVRYHPVNGAFGVLVLTGPVSPFVTDTNPMVDGRALPEVLPWRDHAADPGARRTARVLRAFLVWAHRRLEALPLNRQRVESGLPPLNGLVTQRAGRRKPVASFPGRYGMRGLSVAAGVVYWGIASYLGLAVRKATDSDDPARDIEERLEAARGALVEHDFVHVHTKAADEAAHRKEPEGKRAVIEALDRGLGRAVGPLLEDPGILLAITADHCTPSSGPLVHSGESVPLILCGPGVRQDRVGRFDEVSAAGGALGCVRGGELMHLILNHTDRAKLRTVMDTAEDQPFWPGRYAPFRLDEPGPGGGR